MRPILVAATSSASALEDLARSPANDRRVDWVEARLDQTPYADWDRALRAIDALEASGTPVLATLRSVQEGGGLEDDEARVARYRELLPRVHAIDVELASVHAPALVTAAHAAGKKVVLSSHDFARTPEQKSIEAFVRRGLGLGADIVKIACKVDAPDVYPRLLAALSLAPAGRLAILGMGPYGVALRVFLPAAGSALAFAYLDAPTAPGQLSVPELADILEKIVPGYVPGQHLPIDG